jgi:hypothetical protein
LLLLIVLGATAHAQGAPPPPADPAQLPPTEPSPPPPEPTPPSTQPTAPVLQPYPGQQSPAMQPAPPVAKTVMSKRWAIGVDFGPESYAPDVDGAEATEFGQFELALRYRIRKPIELGLALHLGGADPKIAEGGIYFDFRYRFLAEKPFNVYALASLGVLAVAHEDATDDEKRGRGSLRLGGGVEYRWSWFALAAELRLIHVGKNEDVPQPLDPVTGPYALAAYKLSGLSLALGANFYF